jgi:TRAP-type C4-dicarboxylate transport system permease small subunit
MVALTGADVLGRTLLHRPIVGTLELVEVWMLLVIYLSFAPAHIAGVHPNVEVLLNKMPGRARSGLVTVGRVGSAVGCLALGIALIYRAYYWQFVEPTNALFTGLLHVPYVPFVFAAGIGVLCLVLLLATEHGRGQSE